MMELLVSRGADLNAQWNGYFPIIFAPCETVEPVPLKWLLDHGADPLCPKPRSKYPGTALDYVIRTYSRSEQLGQCIDLLVEAGCVTRYDLPPVLDLLRGRIDLLREHLDAEPSLLHRQFPELDLGATGRRSLTLRGATLLHVAAEYGNVAAAALLLDRGADVNARATVDDAGVGGQTAVFHAVTQSDDGGLPVTLLLVERGADLTVRVKLSGDYERPGEIVECTPLGYALLFGGGSQRRTVTLLRERGAAE
jgi:hypothetical protein